MQNQKYTLVLSRISKLPFLKKVSFTKKQWFFSKVFCLCFRRKRFSSRFSSRLRQQFFYRVFSGLSRNSSTPFLIKPLRKSPFVYSANAARWYGLLLRTQSSFKSWSAAKRIRLLLLRRFHLRSQFRLTKKFIDQFFRQSYSSPLKFVGLQNVGLKGRVPFSGLKKMRPSLQNLQGLSPLFARNCRPPANGAQTRVISANAEKKNPRGTSSLVERLRKAKKFSKKKAPIVRRRSSVNFLRRAQKKGFLYIRRLFPRRWVSPRKRQWKLFRGTLSSRRLFLHYFLKHIFYTGKPLSPILVNQYSFASKELSERWVHWIAFLLLYCAPVFLRSLDFEKRLNLVQWQACSAIALDFPGPTEPFRWPTPILGQQIYDPCELWFYHEQNARNLCFFLNSLEVSLRPLLPFSRSMQFLLHRLYRWYLRFYGIHWFFYGLTPSPLGLVSLSIKKPAAVSFFFFWRPSWDSFDQSLLHDEYYSFKSPQRMIWLTLVFESFSQLPSHLTKILFFQFLVREVRFWGRFFRTVRQQAKRSYYRKKLYDPFFDGDFKYWEDYPRWIFYKLERLFLILPFLSRRLRRSFYFNSQVLSDFAKKRSKDMQEDRLVTGLLARVDYWFRRQSAYYIQLKKHGVQRPLLRSFFLALRFSRFLCHLSYQQFYEPSVFARLAKKAWPSFFSPSFFSPPLLKSRLSFLKKKWKGLKSRRKKIALHQKFPVNFPLVFSFTREHYWTLLLFWSLSFYFRLQLHHRFFFLVHWLQSSFSFSPGFRPSSLEAIYQAVAHRNHSLEPSFFLVSFYWSFVKPVEVFQRSFRQILRQSFFTGKVTAFSQPLPSFYKRYYYIRRLPFSDFCHFWSQTANVAQSKFKRSPRQFSGLASRKVSVYDPIAYVSLPANPFALQLSLTDQPVRFSRSLRKVS